MKRLLRPSRLALLVVLLALSGLALVAGPTPAAHAGSLPNVTAKGFAGGLYLNGSGFTPRGTVLIKIHGHNQNTNKWYLQYKYVTALGPHYVCHTYRFGTICGLNPGGQISAGLVLPPGTVHVIAYDFSSATWSTTSITYVFPIM